MFFLRIDFSISPLHSIHPCPFARTFIQCHPPQTTNSLIFIMVAVTLDQMDLSDVNQLGFFFQFSSIHLSLNTISLSPTLGTIGNKGQKPFPSFTFHCTLLFLDCARMATAQLENIRNKFSIQAIRRIQNHRPRERKEISIVLHLEWKRGWLFVDNAILKTFNFSEFLIITEEGRLNLQMQIFSG